MLCKMLFKTNLSGTFRILSVILIAFPPQFLCMTESERLELRQESEDMFFHGFNAYMQVAWPADELMPLSCKGRFRGREIGRGDIDDALGNFSLTLVDSLDMLAVLGHIDLFEESVLKVTETVSFDTDVVVSVFETNIRMVGGLISGHVISQYLKENYDRMPWYSGQLLNMAMDVANRLLPAFNSSTGLPYPRVNLKTGMKWLDTQQLTCTACAGSMILEFAALSRLSGEKIYEDVAGKAMDYLWSARHRQSNLVGNVLNVNTGDWVRRESGIGAGIDSYYEYVAKAYVLLGEEKYLDRWNTHYSAIMKYLTTGPLMPDVHMHRPTTSSKHFTDALSAFWPGLQVLMGDIAPAIKQHEVLYQIIQKHHFLPEAITSDYQVYWGQHFLRPEFLESTYFLYKATKDPHYLDVGKKVLKALQKYGRVQCGYAAVKDVRTMTHEDRMDSFVLTETFKYLYLLFSKDEELFLDIDQFVFTTEAHLFPVSLAKFSNSTAKPTAQEGFFDFGFGSNTEDEDEFAQSCPSNKFLFPGHEDSVSGAASLRKPLSNLVESSSPTGKTIKRTLLASDFSSTNSEHLRIVKDMGISIISLPDGRTQLLHTMSNAKNREIGEEGVIFMQEMIEIAKQTQVSDSPPKQVRFRNADGRDVVLQAGPAQFGPTLNHNNHISGQIVMANDIKACINSQQNGESMKGKIVFLERGDCMFVEKARVIQSMGAIGGIVTDTTEGSAAASSPLFAMSGDGSQDVTIPMVFLFDQEAQQLLKSMAANPKLVVILEEKPSAHESDSVSGEGSARFVDAAGEDGEEDQIPNRIKSPVHSILTENLKDSPLGPDTPDYISVKTDEKTGEVISETIRTVRNKDGTTRTFKTIHRMTEAEMQALATQSIKRPDNPKTGSTAGAILEEELQDNTTVTQDEENPLSDEDDILAEEEDDFSENEEDDFIEDGEDDLFEESDKSSNLDSEDLKTFDFDKEDFQAFVEESSANLKGYVSNLFKTDPELIGQIISIGFSDLTMALEEIILEQKNVEATFRSLFSRVKIEGAKKFIENIKLSRFIRISGEINPTKEDIESLTKQKSSGIMKLLGDDKVNELMDEYLGGRKGTVNQNQVKLLSTLELILEEINERLQEMEEQDLN